MVGSRCGLIIVEFALLLVEFAVALDASGAVLGAGGLASGHGQPGGVRGGRPARLNGCGRFGQFWEQQSAARCGDVLSGVGCGPDDGAVLELLIAPTTL